MSDMKIRFLLFVFCPFAFLFSPPHCWVLSFAHVDQVGHLTHGEDKERTVYSSLSRRICDLFLCSFAWPWRGRSTSCVTTRPGHAPRDRLQEPERSPKLSWRPRASRAAESSIAAKRGSLCLILNLEEES